MASANKKLLVPILYRSFEVAREESGSIRGLNKEKRTIRVQFSSEAPVKRWFGEEILDHDSKSVDMSRIKSGAAVLCEHDTKMRCGITEGGDITEKRTGEAEVRFARTPLGDQVMAEVEDGTLKWLSVGYRVDKFEVDEDEEEYRAIRWTPLEVSFVSIPADPSARVLRNEPTNAPIMLIRSKRLHDPDPDGHRSGGGGKADLAEPELDADGNPIDPETAARVRAEAEQGEIREVFALGHKWQKEYPGAVDEAEKLVKGGKRMLEQMRGWVMSKMQEKPPRSFVNVIKDKDGTQRGLTLGEAFCRTESYQKFGSKKGDRRTITCEIPDRLSFAQRTTFSATTESLTSIQKLPGVPGILDQQPLAIADLFAQGQTGNTTVRYIQEDSYTNAATAVAEGAAKPEATLNVSEVDATVRKIAVYTKVTDEMLADFDQMSSYINGRLGYMVQALEDNHLLNGTGNTNQIKGVLNFTGIQTVSGAASAIEGILRAIAYVRGANGAGFGEPDAIIVNPLDWMNIKLQKDLNGQFYGGGPFSGIYGQGGYSNVYNMWGLPCVVTTSIAQGTALVGQFRMGAQIFRRMGLSIESTNSNEDDFKNNLVMIRAEERLTLAVYQPNKFCTVTGIVNPA